MNGFFNFKRRKQSNLSFNQFYKIEIETNYEGCARNIFYEQGLDYLQ